MSLLNKRKTSKDNNDSIIRLIMPMIISVVISVICLASMTWAWFTASVNTNSQTVQSAVRSTLVMVYEVGTGEDEEGNEVEIKTLVSPETAEDEQIAPENEQSTDDEVIITDDAVVWELLPEKSYEVVMTGGGTASVGYCKVALSHTVNGSDSAETKLYNTSVFEKDNSVKFTYNTGGFADAEGVTETQYKEYIETTTPPTLTITSCWGSPAEEEETQVALMSLEETEVIELLSDGDVLGLAPIPCPEAKAESSLELEGFEIQEGSVISANDDYQVFLTLQEGYEMPGEVLVNISGKDYVVSTEGSEANGEAPYYDAENGILTIPSSLMSDGDVVSVVAVATLIPEVVEEVAPEEAEDEPEEFVEEIPEEYEEPTEIEEAEDDDDDMPPEGYVPDDNAGKNNEGVSGSESGKSPALGGIAGEDEVEKADVTLNLSQLTINLEETKIPTNADLVFALSAKENMELPKQIVITLDKTIRDEDDEEDEEKGKDKDKDKDKGKDEGKDKDKEDIVEDKTEYIINTDGEDNPEGFEFDAEKLELTISSKLLEGVREITIADVIKDESDDETGNKDEKPTISFEVKNLTFHFTDDEFTSEEDVVITFSTAEDYELPETIVITIDDKEYIVYTSEENLDKNPEGITFDIETGTLVISKDLLEDAEAITIIAEGIKKEDDESEDGENPDDDDDADDDNDTDDDDDHEGKEPEDEEPEDEEAEGEEAEGEETEGEETEGEETDGEETDGEETDGEELEDEKEVEDDIPAVEDVESESDNEDEENNSSDVALPENAEEPETSGDVESGNEPDGYLPEESDSEEQESDESDFADEIVPVDVALTEDRKETLFE